MLFLFCATRHKPATAAARSRGVGRRRRFEEDFWFLLIGLSIFVLRNGCGVQGKGDAEEDTQLKKMVGK